MWELVVSHFAGGLREGRRLPPGARLRRGGVPDHERAEGRAAVPPGRPPRARGTQRSWNKNRKGLNTWFQRCSRILKWNFEIRDIRSCLHYVDFEQDLFNEPLIAKIGVDTAENGLSHVWMWAPYGWQAPQVPTRSSLIKIPVQRFFNSGPLRGNDLLYSLWSKYVLASCPAMCWQHFWRNFRQRKEEREHKPYYANFCGL